MPSHRFFVDASLSLHDTFSIEGEEWHHMVHVMRSSEGESVELINGKGLLAQAKIISLERHRAHLLVESLHQVPLPHFRLLLAIPFMRPAKLQWIVEKGTELGVFSFVFYRAQRSELSQLSSSQLERLHILAVSALKQSGGVYLPSFQVVPDLASLPAAPLSLFGDPSGEVLSFDPLPPSLLFVTGPESGFAPEEKELLEKKGSGVRYNPNTLRAETAPIAAAAIFLHHAMYIPKKS
ncbi:MAG: 16S rRNA (uracil(1498)-N(3))-methyltransferase [Verrucomicrobiota bacterium]|nr:16S rRNA (uracil(1498)-N(3))-methyltransferase [Verrucomicrobiota bacterium]